MVVDKNWEYIAPEINVFVIEINRMLCSSGDALSDYERQSWSDEE